MKIETISWDTAWANLWDILPQAAYFTPSSILTAADKANMKTVWVEDTARLGDEIDDGLALSMLLSRAQVMGTVLLVTDFCFLPNQTPFMFLVENSVNFATEYRAHTGEAVLSGTDTVIVCPKLKTVIVCDHDSHVAVIK